MSPVSERRTLSDLMSRWMTPWRWRCSRPWHVSRLTAAIWPSVIRFAVTTSVSEPPSMYSITTQRSFLCRKLSM
jgi:hypothetical protein